MRTLFSAQSLKAWIAGILVFFASAAQASATGHGHISSTDWWYIGAATVTMIATVYGVGNAPAPVPIITEPKPPAVFQIGGSPASQLPPNSPTSAISSDVGEGIPRPANP